MIDVLITTYNRLGFLKQTIESLLRHAGPVSYRISVIDDHSEDGTVSYLYGIRHLLHRLILSTERRGLVPNFNTMYDALIDDDSHPYLCYLQDDMVAEIGPWLYILMVAHNLYKDTYNLGFSSAHDAREHIPVDLFDLEIASTKLTIKIKRSISFQNVFAEKEFWKSIGKPPELDHNGNVRGFPNDGRGSDIDTWFTGCYSLNRFHRRESAPNCLVMQNKRVLVIPMLTHLGLDKQHSTWRQNREHGF